MSRIIMVAIIDPPSNPPRPVQKKRRRRIKKQQNQAEKHTETIPTLAVMPPNLLLFRSGATHFVCTGRRCSSRRPAPARRTAGLRVWAPELCTLCRAASRTPRCTPTIRSTRSSRHPLRTHTGASLRCDAGVRNNNNNKRSQVETKTIDSMGVERRRSLLTEPSLLIGTMKCFADLKCYSFFFTSQKKKKKKSLSVSFLPANLNTECILVVLELGCRLERILQREAAA